MFSLYSLARRPDGYCNDHSLLQGRLYILAIPLVYTQSCALKLTSTQSHAGDPIGNRSQPSELRLVDCEVGRVGPDTPLLVEHLEVLVCSHLDCRGLGRRGCTSGNLLTAEGEGGRSGCETRGEGGAGKCACQEASSGRDTVERHDEGGER